MMRNALWLWALLCFSVGFFSVGGHWYAGCTAFIGGVMAVYWAWDTPKPEVVYKTAEAPSDGAQDRLNALVATIRDKYGSTEVSELVREAMIRMNYEAKA